MGAAGSRTLERALGDGSDVLSPGSRYWGLENFGNTCYANSVLQALYACSAFRERVLAYHAETPSRDPDEHLLAALAELFASARGATRRDARCVALPWVRVADASVAGAPALARLRARRSARARWRRSALCRA